MATYNRSNILKYSIGSLLQNGFDDWELIVVGDCCTDDTAAVVAAFQDARIRFVNLEHNHGEQAGPNNVGMQLARGKYLAFLNHDDMWLRGHLERGIALLEQHGAELVFGQGLHVVDAGTCGLVGALCGGPQKYQPMMMMVPASLWIMRRELAARVGPWTSAWKISVAPSQDWLYRAYRQGAQILANPVLEAVLISSGNRRNSYSERQEHEHEYWYGRLGDDSLLLGILSGMLGGVIQARISDIVRNARSLLGSMVYRLLFALGVWPPHPAHWVRYWRKGSFLRKLRRTRGLGDGNLPRHRS